MSTDTNLGSSPPDAQQNTISAGADIYRRLEKRKRGSGWMTVGAPVIFVVAVIIAAGAAYAFLVPGNHHAARPPVQAAQNTPTAPTPQPTPPPAAAAPAAEPAAAPPAEPAVTRPHAGARHIEHARVAAQTVSSRPRRAAPASSALNDGSDASAFAPARPTAAPVVTAPPASPAPPVVNAPPASSAASQPQG